MCSTEILRAPRLFRLWNTCPTWNTRKNKLYTRVYIRVRAWEVKSCVPCVPCVPHTIIYIWFVLNNIYNQRFFLLIATKKFSDMEHISLFSNVFHAQNVFQQVAGGFEESGVLAEGCSEWSGSDECVNAKCRDRWQAFCSSATHQRKTSPMYRRHFPRQWRRFRQWRTAVLSQKPVTPRNR